MKDMEKAYEAKQYEDDIYKEWKDSGYFNPDNLPGERKEPFAIMMPPPNVTGVLHLGHALENSIMDIGARYHRMQGKNVLLLPGTDHAAVATQAKVEDMLVKEGMEYPREELGREGLLERIREYAEESKATILGQIQKMGTSADWSRLAYTFDDDRSKTVNEIFVRMYKDGLIYKGYRVVNWSIKGQSTASEDELEYKERTTMLYTFKYSKDFPIPIATTLPETKLGDTAVAVHPEDERYKQYIGQTFTVDVGAQKPLEIDVIADDGIDPEFGTGALGVTPAHSATDFEMYEKNPDIGLIQVIGEDGRMTEDSGAQYAGLPYKEAREKFVQWLRDEGLMIAEEEITHNAAFSDRFKDEIWPMPKDQWFVAVNKPFGEHKKTLRELMKEVVTTGLGGDESKKVNIMPEQFNKVYNHWIDNLRDWCISRQIWWGHRIPVWYRGDEVYCGHEAPEGDGWEQDPDSLDTWFSSGMWPFSTLGWQGENTEDMQKFYPTAWMQMGYEILPLWMARMILMSTYALDDVPFYDVYIHGILRDKDGKKFSKSAGNGIDPLDVIAEYGTDALRLSLIKGIAPGNDARFYYEKVEDARNFVNKLWNVTRFVLMQEEAQQPSELSVADKWIQSKAAELVEGVTQDLENYMFSQAAEKIYAFLWSDFADWYVETTKFMPNPQLTQDILKTVLKLAHPFIPFITEVLWKQMGETSMLMVEQWPTAGLWSRNEEAEREYSQLQELVSGIRNIRREYKIDPAKHLEVINTQFNDAQKAIIENLARVTVLEEKDHINSASVVVGEWQVIIPLDGVVDIEQEKKRVQDEIAQIENYLKGAQAKLSNPGFTDNAPKEVVEETKQLVEERTAALENLKQSLESLQ